MNPIFTSLHANYLARCHHPELQKTTWRSIVKNGFEPDIARDWGTRPSVLLAGESGDLGLALLWIVQAALIRPALAHLHAIDLLTPRQKATLNAVGAEQIGALAHSEPQANPLTISVSRDSLRANGEKKYITGGRIADFLFMTSRKKNDEKISHLLWLPGTLLKPGELTDLSLDALFTNTHACLSFQRKLLPADSHLPVHAPEIRRMIAKWGMVERTLIVEAYTALLQYLCRRVKMTGTIPAIEDALKRQQAVADIAVQQAFAGKFVNFSPDNLKTIGSLADSIIDTAFKAAFEQGNNKELLWRINDAAFIQNFWKRN